MDAPLTCGAHGAKPTTYASKEEGAGADSDHGSHADDYEYYDDDHELAALVVSDDYDGGAEAHLLKLIQEETLSSQPQSGEQADVATAAANTIPNPERKKQHDLYIIADGRLQVDSVYYDIEDYCIER